MLNPSQRKAVETVKGPLRIIAGAGTGKTHTIVARIGYLIELLRIPPERILTLTFTNKAARELNERLVKLKFPKVQALTFHALAARMLRAYWRPDFMILDRRQQEEILGQILNGNEHGLGYEILTDIEMMDYRPPKSGLSNERLEVILKAYRDALSALNAVDFTGLLRTLLDLWQEHPEILEKCQSSFDHILVDEYQDVNAAQIEIVQKLVDRHQNVCVVGDPDQTIYSWRGSDPKALADFEYLYPKAVTVTLAENYRNPANILKGAERLIQNNQNRLPKELRPNALKPGEITLWKNEDEPEEFEKIAFLLGQYLGSHGEMHQADLLDSNCPEGFHRFSDIAILFRTQAEGKRIAAELVRRGYPCQLSAPETFWQKKEIVEFLMHLEPLRFLPSYPEGVAFSDWIRERIDDFVRMGKWNERQVQNFHLVLPYAMAYDSMGIQEALFGFLDETKTEQPIDNILAADKINLLTLHAAKGLEFPVVMVAGLEEGNMPLAKQSEDPAGLEEERRLLYVGMTRATKDLHFFFCVKKMAQERQASRFLEEIGYSTMAFGMLPEKTEISIHRRQIKKAQMKLF